MSPASAPPLWRSLLYVPLNRPRFVEKAHGRRADAIILDLEDGVPEGERDSARAGLAVAITQVGRAGADVLVRVNNAVGQLEADLDAMRECFPAAIVVPKVDSGAVLRRVAGWLDQRPAASHVRLVPLIESARGLLAAADVAEGTPRNVALTLGSEDFAHDVGMEPAEDTLSMPKQLALIAARAGGLMPLGLLGTVADFRDLDGIARVARRSRRFGFEGASCVHPDVVPLLNSAFSPAPEDVSWAERVVDGFEAGIGEGFGAVEVDGHMVDRPVVARARVLLARHARAVERDAL